MASIRDVCICRAVAGWRGENIPSLYLESSDIRGKQAKANSKRLLHDM